MKHTQLSVKEYGLSILLKVGELMQATFDIEVLLHMILTCITKGEGFGFNRAMIFLTENKKIKGRMGVGPFNQEEAQKIWSYMNDNQKDLIETLNELEEEKKKPVGQFNEYVKTLVFSEKVLMDSILRQALEEKKVLYVKEGMNLHLLPLEFVASINCPEFVIVPLVSKGRCFGLIVADNLFSRHLIEPTHFELIQIFSFQISRAIEVVRAHQDLEREKNQLQKTVNSLNKVQTDLIQAEKMAIVGKILIKMAHEIRNPLTVIGGYAHVLNKEIAEKSKPKTHKIIKEVERLEELLTEMLDFSKDKKMDYSYENMEQLLNNQISRLKVELEKKQIQIYKYYEKTPVIQIDKDKIGQVFFNLLKNAIAYSPTLGTIKIIIKNWKKEVKIIIEDEGEGIKEEDKEKVFFPFFSKRIGGIGLGLSVSYDIVKGHRGKIYTKKGDKGAVFVVKLPIELKN